MNVEEYNVMSTMQGMEVDLTVLWHLKRDAQLQLLRLLNHMNPEDCTSEHSQVRRCTGT